MITNRREFIVGAGATVAALHLPAGAAPADGDAAVQTLLSEFVEELLIDYPETATGLGIDNGARAALKAMLSDRSARGRRPSRSGSPSGWSA
jgi:uncharacterized protein (DUF885 family)